MIQFVLPVVASFYKLVRDPHREFFDRIGLDAGEEEFCAYISMGATFKTTINSPATAMTNPAAENVDSLSPSSLYIHNKEATNPHL